MPLLKIFKKIDFSLFFLAILISLLGLTILYPIYDTSELFFTKQIISLTLASLIFFLTSLLDIYLFKNARFIIFLYGLSIFFLILVIFFGSVAGGAQSWFNFGIFSFQPTDLIKFTLVLVLAKFFSKRHVEIKSINHIFVSIIYTLIPFFILAAQPDFGSALLVFLIWFGMILISGLPKKIIFIFFIIISAISVFSYNFLLANYQQKRITTFLHPESDVLGAGYSVSQSKIAIGSGGWTGKGFGEGTQSRLLFLPEYENDFIFAAYAEEWGFLGVVFLFILYSLLIIKIAKIAILGRTNFELLLAAGILIYFIVHIIINIGMNLAILPVTGTTLPFMSYGGSHLLIEFFALGIINVIDKSNKSFNRKSLKIHDIL